MLFGIYTSPTATFRRLTEKPTWLVPLIITVIATLAVTAVSTRYVDWDQQREQAIERMEQRGVTEEQQEQQLEALEKFSTNPLMRYGAPLLGGLVTALVGIFFLVIVYNLALPLLGVAGNFRRTLSVVAWSSLVTVPGALVRIILVLVKQSANVSTSLLLAAPNAKGFLAVLLGRVDLFTIWQLVLTAIGLKVMFEVKGAKAYWLVFGVWVLLTAVLGVLATVGGC